MKLKIIENFFDENDLQEIKSTKLENVTKDKIKVYHNRIDTNGNITAECLSKDFIKKLHLKYHDKTMRILKDLNFKKAELYDFSEFHIIESGSHYKFPIHDDTPDKLLSGVIYISPNENTGTIFYDNKKGHNKTVIDWKVNKGIFFSRLENETWHSYEGDGKNNRIVLVLNLMTKRIRDVYKIENKNYFYGRFRYWINPYLYKFFKFTI